MLTMTVSEARARLREALESVRAGEEIELSQNGIVVAILVHPDRLNPRVRTANTIAAENMMNVFRDLQKNPPRRTPPGLSNARAETLIRELRDERDTDWE